MTTHEERARQILAQAEADNAEHPIGVGKHRVWRIAEALAKAEAQRDQLVALLHSLRASGLKIDQMHDVDRALADVDKENA